MHGKLFGSAFAFEKTALIFSICSDKIHGFEYPPGQRIIVKPLNEIKSSHDHDAIFSFDGK